MKRLTVTNATLMAPLIILFWMVGLPETGGSLMAQNRLEIGTKLDGWQDLDGIDDQKHSLADLQDFDVVVVCFTCNTCPYAIDYEQRLSDLHQRFAAEQPAKVAVVAINSNATESDNLEKMKERAAERQFPYLYLRDPDQVAAKQFKAMYTPEFFVLDRQRKLRYQGALDDKTKVEEVSRHYVVEAIEAIRADMDPGTTFQQPRGCKIRFPKPKRDL